MGGYSFSTYPLWISTHHQRKRHPGRLGLRVHHKCKVMWLVQALLRREAQWAMTVALPLARKPHGQLLPKARDRIVMQRARPEKVAVVRARIRLTRSSFY